MFDIVRFGVVGAGSISVRGILPHLSMDDVQDRVRLTAVCDPAPGRAAAAAERFRIPHHYETYEELLAAGKCDAITIASPIGLHYEQGKAAIEAGLHVHFNKSMTTTVDEADDLIERAKRKGVKLVSCPGQMLRPMFQRYRDLIQEGALGRLTWAVTGSAFGTYHERERVRHGDDPLTNINPAWYFRRPGGGPLYDMTVYGLHALTGILGPAKRVTAMSGVRIHEREFRGEMLPTDMDDNTFMVLDFGDNLFAFVYGAAAGGIPNTWGPMFMGTKGTLGNGRLNDQPIDYPGRELEEAHKDANAALPHVVGAHRGNEEAHVYEDIMQLVDWIRADKPTIATAEHARHVIEIFDAGYRSAASGQAQTLRTTF
jgi:predicted dehydrogenase